MKFASINGIHNRNQNATLRKTHSAHSRANQFTINIEIDVFACSGIIYKFSYIFGHAQIYKVFQSKFEELY